MSSFGHLYVLPQGGLRGLLPVTNRVKGNGAYLKHVMSTFEPFSPCPHSERSYHHSVFSFWQSPLSRSSSVASDKHVLIPIEGDPK